MKVSFLNRKKEKLVGVLEGVGKKGVVLCHGFTGQKAGTKVFSDALKKDFLVLRFDFSGNGESEGLFEEADYSKETEDALCAIEFMRKQGCSSIGIVGHSMGGAVAILTASRTKVSCVASLASPASPRPELMAKHAREWVGKELPPAFLRDIAKIDIVGAAARVNAPLLIVHGNSDSIIDVSEADKLYENAKDPKKKVIIKNMDHDFAGKVQDVIREVVEWLKIYL
ncbi:MAG: alpha/beta fold hydrolase [Candidatus Woesearchaeota archaeon]|nr:alpha/beta fold hydrolase [Candidatus Woesearchaeota archaeon]